MDYRRKAASSLKNPATPFQPWNTNLSRGMPPALAARMLLWQLSGVFPEEARKALADKERALEISGLRSYILDNASGLADYRLKPEKSEGLRGLGGIEGNVNHLIASRMKKRGMS